MHEIFFRCKKIVTVSLKLYFYTHRQGSITKLPYSIKNIDDVEARCQRVSFYENHGLYNLIYDASANALDKFFMFRKGFTPYSRDEKRRFREVRKKVRTCCWKYRKKIRIMELFSFEMPRLFHFLQRIRNNVFHRD